MSVSDEQTTLADADEGHRGEVDAGGGRDDEAVAEENGGLFPTAQGDRAAELEERFSLPVIVAAIASIPAVFLTMMDGAAATVGQAINYASVAVFLSEFLVLVWAAEDKRQWAREHKLPILVLVAAIPAVFLFVGAVQVLRLANQGVRLARFLTALKIARVRQLFRAFRKLRERTGLRGRRWNAVRAGFLVLGVVALALVLADPESETRKVLDWLVEALGVPGIIGAALGLAVVGGCVYVAYRRWDGRVET